MTELGIKVSMSVNDTFGRSCTAGGKKDGGCIIPMGFSRSIGFPGNLTDLV